MFFHQLFEWMVSHTLFWSVIHFYTYSGSHHVRESKYIISNSLFSISYLCNCGYSLNIFLNNIFQFAQISRRTWKLYPVDRSIFLLLFVISSEQICWYSRLSYAATLPILSLDALSDWKIKLVTNEFRKFKILWRNSRLHVGFWLCIIFIAIFMVWLNIPEWIWN